ALHRVLDGLEIGEDQLGGDGLHVAGGVDGSVHAGDVRVGEGTGDLADRLGFAYVGEELVAQAITLAGTLDDAGDVHEGHGRRQQLLAAEDLGELRQPRVGQRDHADVRIDGRERIVRGEDLGAGQGV